MRNKLYTLFFALLLNACTSHLEPTAINPRYTPSEARKYVNWWADNIRPLQRDVFQDALAGDNTALRRILMDEDNSFGPPDQDGEPASAREHPVAGAGRRRPLHSRRSLVHP